MAIKDFEVYHNFSYDDDNLEERTIKIESNKNTRDELLKKYRFKIVEPSWKGNESDYDIIVGKLPDWSGVNKYYVLKNESSCGGKHLMLLCDPKNLLSFGGESKGNILTIYGGRE